MGTGYDCSDVKAHTAATSITPAQRRWRNLLVAAMARQGFVNYSKEWWHFSLPGAAGPAYDFPIRTAPPLIPGKSVRDRPMTQRFIRDPRGLQPVAAVRRRRSVRAGPAADGGGRGQWRRVRREQELSEFGQHWGSAAMAARGRARQREHAKTADLRCPRQPARRGRVSSGLSRIDGAQRPCRHAQFDLDRAGQAGRRRRRSGARRKILHGGAGRDRTSLSDHDDARVGGGAGGAAGSAGQDDAGDRARVPTIRASRHGGPSAA